MIARLAERNTAVDLSPKLPDGVTGPPSSYRGRLLWVEEHGGLGVERPVQPRAAGELPAGQAVELLLAEETTRLRADTRIVAVRPHRLNAETTIVALRLEPPHDIRSDQRREFYRASTLAVGLDPVLFEPIRHGASALPGGSPLSDASETAAADLGAKRVEGLVINVSGGGLGVSVPASRRLLDSLPPSRCYTTDLALPDGEPPVRLTLKLVHVQPIEGGRVFFGMQIEEPDPGLRSEIEDRLVRFATSLERRELRRKRRA